MNRKKQHCLHLNFGMFRVLMWSRIWLWPNVNEHECHLYCIVLSDAPYHEKAFKQNQNLNCYLGPFLVSLQEKSKWWSCCSENIQFHLLWFFIWAFHHHMPHCYFLLLLVFSEGLQPICLFFLFAPIPSIVSGLFQSQIQQVSLCIHSAISCVWHHFFVAKRQACF